MSGRRRRRGAGREAQIVRLVAGVVAAAAAGTGKAEPSGGAQATADDVRLADQVAREMALSGQPLTDDLYAAVLAEMTALRLAEERGTDD